MSRPRLADTLGYKVEEEHNPNGLITFTVTSPEGEEVLVGTANDTRTMNNRITSVLRKRHPLNRGTPVSLLKLGGAAEAAGALREQADLFASRAAALSEQATTLADEAAQYQREADALHGAADLLEGTRPKPEVDPRDQGEPE